LEIHPTAIVHPGAKIGPGVKIGAYSLIGENVQIERDTVIGSHVVLEGWTEIGEGCQISPFASVGAAPQAIRYRGEPTRLVIGKRNIIRELVTVNRGTPEGGGITSLGDGNLIMAYSHLHDLPDRQPGNSANSSTLASHYGGRPCHRRGWWHSPICACGLLRDHRQQSAIPRTSLPT
jgi:UDP-N-acetylglucosamine acyltransferase